MFAAQMKGKGTAIDTTHTHTHTHNVVLTFAKSISAAATASKSGRTVAFIFSNAAQVKGGAERSGCVREGSARERQYEWPGRKNARCIFSHSLWQALLSEIQQAGRKNRTQNRVASPACAARCLWVIADLVWYAVHCAIVERGGGRERETTRVR